MSSFVLRMMIILCIKLITMIKSFSGTLLKTITQTFSMRKNEPFMKISPNALRRLKQIMSEKKEGGLVGVKISLTKKGCSGLGYNMDYIREQQIKKFDEVVEDSGIKVVVDSKAIMALVGTEMNFVEDQLGSQFVFNNPNEKGKCGCGASFYL